MCMIVCAVTKDFGVIATDSALTTKDKIEYNNMKLFYWGSKYLCTGMGIPAYIAKLDFSRFTLDMDGLSMYLEDYFKNTREHVKETLKNLDGEDVFNPSLCFFVLGVHKGKPVLAQFNSYLNFKPKYLFSSDGPKFATIYYDPEEKKKVQMYKDTNEYMENKVKKLQKKGIEMTPGLLGEILTRGIYKKADLEQEMTGKKSTGGPVSVASLYSNGLAFSLTHTIQ